MQDNETLRIKMEDNLNQCEYFHLIEFKVFFLFLDARVGQGGLI